MISDIESGVELPKAYPFEVSVNNPDVVKITCTGHDPRQLWTTKDA